MPKINGHARQCTVAVVDAVVAGGAVVSAADSIVLGR